VLQSPLAPHVASPQELKSRIEAERRGCPFLVYRDGAGAQAIVALEELGRLTIGRRPGNEIALPWDDEVSRVHAALERAGADWVVVDDGLSRNGTYVNGERVTGRRRLSEGDVVRFGKTLVAYRAPLQHRDKTTLAESGTPFTASLSDTQRAVLIALCRPLKHSRTHATPATNQQIAGELHLSIDAVKSHLRALFQRFGIEHLPQNQKRSRLVAEALQSGILATRDL
jgi:pSer/pThr/pTyr-binding forkhead associated (FHA) protein